MHVSNFIEEITNFIRPITILTIPIANNIPRPIAAKTSPAIAYPQLAVLGIGLSSAIKTEGTISAAPFSDFPLN